MLHWLYWLYWFFFALSQVGRARNPKKSLLWQCARRRYDELRGGARVERPGSS
jgi:hypothetical protein